MSPSPLDARLRRLRRVYGRAGYRIWKVPANSRWYQECGPFAVVDSFANRIVEKGLHLEDLERSAARS